MQHIANVLKLLGASSDDAGKHAADIMALETALAKVSLGNVERRDPENIYHKEELSKFAADTPNFDVVEFLRDSGTPVVTDLNVATPQFFAGLNQLLATTDLETMKNYMRVFLVDSFSSRLPKPFDDENFDFFGRKLQGIPEQEARWKRCVNATDAALGEVLGKVYVEQYFAGDSKSRTAAEVKQIESAMGRDLDQLTWMGPATKTKAHEKLAAIVDKIGYPNKWRDYSALTLKPGDALGNSLRATRVREQPPTPQDWKPVDQGRVGHDPAHCQRRLQPSLNNINFPAGILQPPLLRRTASDADKSWRHRRHRRPRAHARLRRRGPQVRCARQS